MMLCISHSQGGAPTCLKQKRELYNALTRARVCADTQTFHYHLLRLHAASSRACINIPEAIKTEVTKPTAHATFLVLT